MTTAHPLATVAWLMLLIDVLISPACPLPPVHPSLDSQTDPPKSLIGSDHSSAQNPSDGSLSLQAKAKILASAKGTFTIQAPHVHRPPSKAQSQILIFNFDLFLRMAPKWHKLQVPPNLSLSLTVACETRCSLAPGLRLHYFSLLGPCAHSTPATLASLPSSFRALVPLYVGEGEGSS